MVQCKNDGNSITINLRTFVQFIMSPIFHETMNNHEAIQSKAFEVHEAMNICIFDHSCKHHKL